MNATLRISVSLALAVSLAACGKNTKENAPIADEGMPGVEITSDDGQTRTVQSTDGVIEATGARGDSAARFPAYAPAYPGAKVQASVDMDAGGIKQHIITMLTADEAEKVLAFYESQALAAGLPVKRIESATGPMLSIGEPGLGGLADTMITAMATSSGTTVNIAVTAK
jgi:hypothetical protein